MPEYTRALRSIFHAQVAVKEKKNVSDEKVIHLSAPSVGSSSTAGYAQLHQVSLNLAATADNAVRGAIELIQRTVENIDCYTGFSSSWTSGIENEMRLAEAELLDVSESIKSTLESVFLQNASMLRNEGSETSDGTIWQVLGSSKKASEGSHDLLLHVERILEEERAAVAAARIQLTLCKEEIREFKNRQLFYASGGVKPFEEGLCSSLRSSVSTSPRNVEENNDLPPDQEGTTCMPSPPSSFSSSPSAPVMKLRMMSGSKTLLESVVKHVSNTVKEADDAFTRQLLKAAGHVKSTDVRSGEKGVFNERNATSISRRGGGGGGGEYLLPLNYSAEEERQLAAQHVMLEERQRKSLAEDAVAVEVAVRELSHLNSLVNEAVLSQREKFTILMKNTEDAQLSMKKAVKELEKPLQSFWSPKRQLMALLWLCAIMVWLANFFVR